MLASLHDVWGSGRGRVRQAAPHIRLVAGAAAFAGCLVSDGTTVTGTLCAGALALTWVLACGPPSRVLRASFGMGLALSLPYFLLVPLLPDAATLSARGSGLLVPWAILVRALSGTLVCVATATALSVADLRAGLLRLPVPSVVSAILLQIIHQTATLSHETRRVAAAMAVRGASARGLTAWRVLSSLPRVWLPRIIVRAERVGAAMELRGYGAGPAPRFDRAPLTPADWATLGGAVGGLLVALALRIGRSP